jgi:hypothetical protein
LSSVRDIWDCRPLATSLRNEFFASIVDETFRTPNSSFATIIAGETRAAVFPWNENAKMTVGSANNAAIKGGNSMTSRMFTAIALAAGVFVAGAA